MQADSESFPAPTSGACANSQRWARVLLVGGAGGIGSALAQALLREGVEELIVASSSPRPTRSDCTVEQVDVGDLGSVQALAQRLGDRPLQAVINCAGVNGRGALDADGWASTARREMEVNYFGMLHLAAVFGPSLAASGGGSFVALLSFLSFVSLPGMATYCASKAAAHSVLQTLRAQWAPRGVRVCGIYPTAVDTEMSRGVAGPKLSPDALAQAVLQALRSGSTEAVFPGDAAAAFAQYLADPLAVQRAAGGEVSSG